MLNQEISIPEGGFMRLKQVLALIPIGRTKWLDGVKAGQFPAPVKLGRCALYRAKDIAELISRIEGGEHEKAAK